MLLLTTLRLLTFDLDDTLFPCGPVVARANAELVNAFVSRGVSGDAVSAKGIQDQIRVERQRSPVPQTYSAMRELAIVSLLRDHGHGQGASTELAKELFDVWLQARHRAADELLFPGVKDALARCRQRVPDAVFGAITNGRGDPAYMPSVAEFFDFTVSGEDAGVFPARKPEAGIYKAALGLAGVAAPYWAHVGDCLVNDVAASKALGARTVWLDLEVEQGEAAFTFSTASPQEQAERRARAEAAAGDVDVRISAIRDLPDALDELVLDGAAS